MRVRAEIGLVVGALLCVQVVTSFGAIGLLSRMSPAIAQILRENLYSLQAVDEMLSALVLSEVRPKLAESQFEAALARAHKNVTEEEEQPALAEIDTHYRAALRGDLAARHAVVGALQALASVNHASTRSADASARSLGSAGAWAAALLGALGCVFSALALGRLTRKLVLPVADLEDTVLAFRTGNALRRTRRTDMPQEFGRVAQALDDLLDDRTLEPPSAPAEPLGELERQALAHLLSTQQDPTVLVDSEGRLCAVGASALELLDDSVAGQARARRVRAGPNAGDSRLGWTPLEGGALCTLQGPPPEQA